VELQDIHLIQAVLEKHCNILESLELGFPSLSQEWNLTFPIFPKLKELIMKIGFGYEINVDKIIRCHFQFPTDDGVINYVLHFPILQSLSIDCCFGRVNKETIWTDFNEFFALFFPFLRANRDDNETEICKTMRELNIPYIDEKNEEMLICPVMTELTTMFPNVHNKWMNDSKNNANRTDAIEEENLPSTSTKIKSVLRRLNLEKMLKTRKLNKENSE
jgi:hypothetical protein